MLEAYDLDKDGTAETALDTWNYSSDIYFIVIEGEDYFTKALKFIKAE